MRALAGRAGRDELAVERERDRAEVAGRVGVGERAAERAAVAHLRVGHGRRRLRDQRRVLLHERVVHDRRRAWSSRR